MSVRALVGEGLSVRLGERRVLQEVGLAVAAGELLGLLGPNGAGKSTLLKVLANLLPPDTGRVLVDGRSARALGARNLAKVMAYLPQGGDCHWPLAVEQVVALGRLPHRASWTSMDLDAEQWAPVRAAMRYTDLERLARRSIDTLSGGERARVLLARALAGEPRIVLADEPIAGLDPAHRLDVMALLRRLAGSGAAVVAVLHDLTMATRFCDRVVLLHEGRVVAEGTPATVLSPANLARYYGIRAETVETPHGRFVIPIERLRECDDTADPA